MSNKKEIVWNIVNALLAGGLVLMGALSTGEITLNAFLLALTAAVAIAINQFKAYWMKEEPEYSSRVGAFI